LALVDSWYGTLAFIAGWSFTIWGLGLYIGTGIGYIRDAVATIAAVSKTSKRSR